MCKNVHKGKSLLDTVKSMDLIKNPKGSNSTLEYLEKSLVEIFEKYLK